MLRNNKSGWIEVICGPMFSGKTEELIRRLKRAVIAKKRILVFKPKIDTRYSDKFVVSHNNNTIESVIIENEDDILKLSKDVNIIGIDEIQFFSGKIIKICIALANQGKRVIVSGLDKDFKAQPFGSIHMLMVDAEYVSKINAICMVCGDPANFSQRISTEKKQVVIGEIDKYEARCRKCFHP